MIVDNFLLYDSIFTLLKTELLVKNSEFARIMRELSWNGARGRPKGFSHEKAGKLDDAIRLDLMKRIIKNKQVLPKSLIVANHKNLLVENGYTVWGEDPFFGEVIKRG